MGARVCYYVLKSHSIVSVAVWRGTSATGQERETRNCQFAVKAQDTGGI